MSKPGKKYPPMMVDREGGLELSAEFVRDKKIKTGDEYAVWEKGGGFILVFKRNGRWENPIPKHAHRGKVEPALPEISVKLPKLTKPIFKPIPETLTDGWMFGAYTRYADPKGCTDGDGFIIAPDGQRAELDWSVGTDKLKRLDRSDKRIWGVFEVGFPRTVRSKPDLVENFRAVLPQIKIAFARHQKRRL